MKRRGNYVQAAHCDLVHNSVRGKMSGNPLRLLASEQLAILDLAQGDVEAATNRLSEILQDAELTQGLRQRASQMMIALGKDPTALGQ